MKMRKQSGLLITILLVILAGLRMSYAQEATDTPDAGWPVEERCVGEPTKPPEGWKYEGMLFTADNGMYSEDGGGIYAIRQQVSTPYYVAFNGKDIVYAGALSPDGKWFAVPYGESIDQHIDGVGNHTGSEYLVDAIRIYRTDYTHLAYQIDWRLSAQNVVINKIMWINNDQLVYPLNEASSSKRVRTVVNPFTDERSKWTDVRETLTLEQWRTFLEYSNPHEDGWVIEPEVSERTQELVDQYGLEKIAIRWLPNSSRFIAARPSYSGGRLFVFNEQDGLEQIITNKTVSQVKVSADGRYVAFQTGETGYQSQEAPEINIADLQTQTISQLCYHADYPTFAWSPFSDQLAITKDGVISILDLDSWRSYVIATKQGRLVGWRKGW